MAPILPHMELKPTHAFLTLQYKNLKCKGRNPLYLPSWKKLTGVKVCGAKSCGGAKFAKQVKGCSKSRHRGYATTHDIYCLLDL